MWYLNHLAKYSKHREKTLKTNITSSCFQDAGKSLSPTSSTLAWSWQVLTKTCTVSMSRNLTAPSCKSRRFVSSLIIYWWQRLHSSSPDWNSGFVPFLYNTSFWCLALACFRAIAGATTFEFRPQRVDVRRPYTPYLAGTITAWEVYRIQL